MVFSTNILVVLPFFATSVFGCAPGLSSDTQYLVTVSGVELPLSFVYATTENTGIATASSDDDATANIDDFADNFIKSNIKEYIEETLGYPAILINTLLTDFDVKLDTDYTALGCANFINIYQSAGTTTTVAPNSNRNGTWCIYNNDNVITQYCPNQNGAVPTCPSTAVNLPKNVSNLIFDVTPGVSLLTSQPRTFWTSFLQQLLTDLQGSTYAAAFQNSKITYAKKTSST